ncbi:hypothetical protein ACFX2B_040085 [Malus domestica]
MSEGIVPVVKKSPISIYLRLPQQRHTLSALLHLREMAFQQTLSSHSVFFIPWDTPANNPFKAKVFHIIKVESKSISYHAFSLSFSLSLFYDKEKESNQPAFGINLPIWSQLPGTPS